MEEKVRYYAVETKCGHVRKNNFIRITYGVQASSKSEAASIARYIPRVKHDKKDAIFSVKEISYEEYLELNDRNSKDPYLAVHSRQDQNYYCSDLYNRIECEEKEDNYKKTREERLNYKKKKYLSVLKTDRYLSRISY